MAKITRAIRFPNGETYEYDRTSTYWDGLIEKGEAELIKGAAAHAAVREYHRQELLKIIKPRSILRVVCVHTGGGMYRPTRYRVFVPIISADGIPVIQEITRDVIKAVGFASRDGEIVMSGYGYSRSFQIGYSLGSVLWPDGTPEPHRMRNGEPDSAGGYALNVEG